MNNNKPQLEFENAMAGTYNILEEMETLLYAIGDSAKSYTEDEMMNMLIGMLDLQKARYEKMWQYWDAFCKVNKIGEYSSTGPFSTRRLREFQETSADVNECEVTLPEGYEEELFDEFKGMEEMKIDEDNT